MAQTWRSPNDLLQAARDFMLEGREPSSHEDWQLIFNFLCCNIDVSVQPDAVLIFLILYDTPMTDAEVRSISAFQVARSVTTKED